MNANEQIKVGAVVLYAQNTAPGQRFRIEQWSPFLKEQGIELEFIPFADSALTEILPQSGQYLAKAAALTNATLRRMRQALGWKKYDAIYLYRAASIVGPALIERALPLFRRPIIYDFDDAIFHLDTHPANRNFGWLKFPGKTGAICRLSSHVVVGCEYLADYARKYNTQVTVVPTSIDTDLYQPIVRKKQNQKVVIGWTGSATSQSHLELFAGMLKKVTELRDVEIRVQSNRAPSLPGLRVNWRPWSSDSEVYEISEFDIGIKPMPDDPWSRGKCPMKELQYMALGVPTVASNVGTSPEVIQHGENGFLASNEKEWITSLTRLIDDQTLRLRLGTAGRKTVEDRYSMRRCAHQFADVLWAAVRSQDPQAAHLLQDSKSI